MLLALVASLPYPKLLRSVLYGRFADGCIAVRFLSMMHCWLLFRQSMGSFGCGFAPVIANYPRIECESSCIVALVMTILPCDGCMFVFWGPWSSQERNRGSCTCSKARLRPSSLHRPSPHIRRLPLSRGECLFFPISPAGKLASWGRGCAPLSFDTLEGSLRLGFTDGCEIPPKRHPTHTWGPPTRDIQAVSFLLVTVIVVQLPSERG